MIKKYQSGANLYKETGIKTSNQGKLIVMLYDEAIKQTEIAIAGLQQNQHRYDEINNAIIKAQNIVTELIVSLDFDNNNEIARNLHTLYDYFNAQLTEANISKSAAPLQTILPMLIDLAQAWRQITDEVETSKKTVFPGVNIVS